MKALLHGAVLAAVMIAAISFSGRCPQASAVEPQVPAPPENAPRLEQERRNDERMWAVMCQMLVDFGYEEKAARLDAAWQQTKTPQQWAALKQQQAAAPRRDAPASVPRPEIVAVARRCEAAAAGLEGALAAACQASGNVAEITAGLVFWTQRGGRPTLQGRNDLALHFLYGAYCEATTEQGATAAVWKEQWDWANGKPYDCDDLAAGLAGAEWARRARADAGWLRDWAAFRKTLAANLPVFHYGTGHQTPQRLAQIHQDIRHSFNR